MWNDNSLIVLRPAPDHYVETVHKLKHVSIPLFARHPGLASTREEAYKMGVRPHLFTMKCCSKIELSWNCLQKCDLTNIRLDGVLFPLIQTSNEMRSVNIQVPIWSSPSANELDFGYLPKVRVRTAKLLIVALIAKLLIGALIVKVARANLDHDKFRH
jgi:hypothetical protein